MSIYIYLSIYLSSYIIYIYIYISQENITAACHFKRGGPHAVASFRPAKGMGWLRTNKVNANGAAAKEIDFDRLGKKVRPGTFGKIKVG